MEPSGPDDATAAALADADHLSDPRDGYLLPDYEGYCFAGVPDTVASAFGAPACRPLPDDVLAGVETDVDNVVLVLADGLGYDAWKREGTAFFGAVAGRGRVTPLTSIYPSETAAAITTVHTGAQPVEHGVLGWDQYVPDAGAVVDALPFSLSGGEPGDARSAMDPDDLFDAEPVYGRLADAGVSSHVFQPASTLDTPYSRQVLGDATRHPYDDVAEMAAHLRTFLEGAGGRNYCYAYVPNVDLTAHEYGTDAAEYRAQVAMLSECLRRELIRNLSADAARRTLLLVTADHGEVDVRPRESVDLLSIDAVAGNLRSGPDGAPIPPTGGPRNVHLHLEDGTEESVAGAFRSRLDARVFTRAAALSGLLGDREPSALARRRCGDLVVVPRDGTAWYEDGGGDMDKLGQHGGLHPREMVVPFAAVRLGAL